MKSYDNLDTHYFEYLHLEGYHRLVVPHSNTLSEYCLPYVKTGGKFISYKSEKITDEMNAAKNAIKILGGNISGQVEFILPDSDIYRNLFIINKIKDSPMKYQRKAGLPSKEPLC